MTDRDRFKKAVIPHLDFIYKSAYRLCGNPADAEKLTQKTFLLAFNEFHRLKDLSECRDWLFNILRDTFMRMADNGKEFVKVKLDLDAFDLEGYSDYNCLLKEPKNFSDRITEKQIQNALNKLDEKYKIPLVFYYLTGASYKEIAGTLGISVGAAMSRILRGKIFLKKELLFSLAE